MKCRQLLCLLFISLISLLSAVNGFCQNAAAVSNEERYNSYLKFPLLVKGSYIYPRWLADGNRFWYAGGTADSTIIYLIDPKRNTRTELFDLERLKRSLEPSLGKDPLNKGVPFREFSFVGKGDSIRFVKEGRAFLLSLADYALVPLTAAEAPGTAGSGSWSPDKQNFVFAGDKNVWLGNAAGSQTTKISADGSNDIEWTIPDACWSPDSKKLLLKRSDGRKAQHIPVINYTKAEEGTEWSVYPKTGGRLVIPELYVLDIATNKKVTIDLGIDSQQYVFPVGWRPDGSELLFMRLNRTGKKLELLAADPHTGRSRVLITEERDTFVAGLDFIINKGARQCTLLKQSSRLIWMSERDGYKHLYLYDMNGRLIRRLTSGNFPVVQVLYADEKNGWLYFSANAETDLYATNLYRMDMEGRRFSKLTEGAGPHYIQFAPSGNYFLDTWSTPSLPSTTELRSADGRMLQVVTKADTSLLHKIGFRPPEPFVVKAADGKTDLYGILYKPCDFDSSKKYPVVDFIYGGPFMTIVQHGFLPNNGSSLRAHALAQMGYITFELDARGTTDRSKAFQDAVYGNIGRYEIPDHVTALQQLAAKNAYMDMSRVGIFGHSWGGYFALRGMLTAPDVFHAGIASAPGELTEGAEINEPYMGLLHQNSAGYNYGNNARLADQLKGRLLLVHGTADVSAPFSTTVRMIEALVNAGKPYELLLFPQQTHNYEGAAELYWNRILVDFFEKNLKKKN